MEKIVQDRELYQWLERVDRDLAEEARVGGCVHCAGKLHRGDYARKPRGVPEAVVGGWERRLSFCCSRQGCRKRKTPPSVRFLGRKVYVGVVVVLLAAMVHGLSKERVRRLGEALGIDRRTLLRWGRWWTETFVKSGFWRAERGRFGRPLREDRMPLALVEGFCGMEREGLVRLLKFLSPMTTGSCQGVVAM